MNELVMDLNSAAYDFSNDSLVKNSLLKGLLARQTSRKPVSFEELDNGLSPRKNLGREPDAPAKEKGRGL